MIVCRHRLPITVWCFTQYGTKKNKTNYKHQAMKEAKGLNLKNSMPYCVKYVLYAVLFFQRWKKIKLTIKIIKNDFRFQI